MRRRLTNTDYENIYTYAEEHGRGSNIVLAETFGITKEHVGLIVTAFRCVMTNTPIRNKNILKQQRVMDAAKHYRLQKLNSAYSPTNIMYNSVVKNTTANTESTNLSFIDEYINKNAFEIEVLRNRILLLEENIRIAQEFAARLS